MPRRERSAELSRALSRESAGTQCHAVIYAGAGAPSRPVGDSSLVRFGQQVAFSGMSVEHAGARLEWLASARKVKG